jgi:sulfite oxidase
MNGKPLTAAHGAPLRVIVPGVAGARSVKWLDTITIAEEESQNHYMQRDYKVLPPDAVDAESAEKYWGSTPPLMNMPCNSVIAYPVSEETIELSDEGLQLKGYALPQGDQGPVVKVEVSLDDGKTWRGAKFQHEDSGSKWAWALWHMELSKSELSSRGKASEDGKSRIITFFSKATDQGGNTQEPAEWNLRGVAYNGYGEARDVKVVL